MIRLKRLDFTLLLLVFAVSLGVRVAFARGFDGLYGQDAYAYYNFAGELGQAIAEHRPPEPFFWPLGDPVLLALSFAVFGTAPLTAQALTILLGALLAPLIYILARQLETQSFVALVASLLAAFCGQAIQSSIVVMSDIPALFWTTFSAVLLLHYLHTCRRRWLVLSALMLALACITRWLYLVLIPIWGVTLLLTWRRIRWHEIIASGVAAALVLVPQAVVSIHSPFPVLDHPWVAGWSLSNVVSHKFNNEDGQFDYAQINALFYAKPYYDPYYLAPLFTPFILLGVCSLRHQRAYLALLLGWALLPYAFLAGIPYQNIRFPLILVPTVAILAAIGIQTLLTAVTSRRPKTTFAGAGLSTFRLPNRNFALARILIPLLFTVGLFWMFAAGQPIINQFVANQQRDKAAVQWAIQNLPPAARVYCYGLTEPLRIYAPFEVRELYDETPVTIALQLADGKDSYFFSNIWVLDNQWAGRPLQTTFHWLRDTPGLNYLDRIGNYILFKIGANNENRTPASGLQQSVG
jgi:hypothetical protein